MFHGEITFYVKINFWKGYVITSEKAKYNLLSSSELKKLSARFCHALNILWGTQNMVHRNDCHNTPKRNELKVYISLKEKRLACFAKS